MRKVVGERKKKGKKREKEIMNEFEKIKCNKDYVLEDNDK